MPPSRRLSDALPARCFYARLGIRQDAGEDNRRGGGVTIFQIAFNKYQDRFVLTDGLFSLFCNRILLTKKITKILTNFASKIGMPVSLKL